MNQPNAVACPICHKKTPWTPANTFRPFCSERCKLIDLGEWADEGYRVPGDPANLNELPDDDQE